MRIAREEIFGPVVSVMRCRSLDEAIEIGNGVEYGLSASIYTQDINRAFAAMRDMYTGIFYVNAPTIGAEVHLPFGGTKNTGNGHREAGVAALDVFSEWKSIYIDFSGKLQRAQIDVEESAGHPGHRTRAVSLYGVLDRVPRLCSCSCHCTAAGWALRGQPFALSVFGNVGLLLPPIAVCAIILRRRQPLGRVPAPVLGHHRDQHRPLDHRPLRMGVRRDLSSGGDRGCSGTPSSACAAASVR